MKPFPPPMKPSRQRPELANFGIPEGFDFEAHAVDLERAEKRAFRTFNASLGVIALVIAVLLSGGLDVVGILLLAVTIFFPLMFVGGAYLFGWAESLIVGQTDAGKIEPRVARYLKAKDE